MKKLEEKQIVQTDPLNPENGTEPNYTEQKDYRVNTQNQKTRVIKVKPNTTNTVHFTLLTHMEFVFALMCSVNLHVS